MWEARPDPLLRLGATSSAVAGLREIIAKEEPLGQALTRVAHAAARAVPDADLVSITVLSEQVWRTVARTADDAVPLDREQYESDRGPSLESARLRRPVRAQIGRERDRWPEFDTSAARAGVRAYLSVPLLVEVAESVQLLGSLNIYSHNAGAFDPFDEGLTNLYSVAAGQAIAAARRWQAARESVAQLERALETRAEIDQAKGALMAIHGCTADEAFARLVEQSQRHNIRVHTLARRFLTELGSRAASD
ncbi:ANTAR domain-containing protein [Nocardia sp. CDC159]|uniref:ANTAR domain-containing protein n=1 Tax=Nocardia pulmonis TaxID=2951408 RepID=A0A9X2ECV9_9NOCA|nr:MULTISPECIES: GAF and ANTAR domain-containing protein [Nocardia]MCM6778055.1 ANTAR domain-containing protein [Nocardia pulmonis]MCM6790944.1 ANTAR domain-containing protein [Nocardia sp. CDC159]